MSGSNEPVEERERAFDSESGDETARDVTVFDDGLSVRLAEKLPVRYARMGDVVFGMSDDNLTYARGQADANPGRAGGLRDTAES